MPTFMFVLRSKLLLNRTTQFSTRKEQRRGEHRNCVPTNITAGPLNERSGKRHSKTESEEIVQTG